MCIITKIIIVNQQVDRAELFYSFIQMKIGDRRITSTSFPHTQQYHKLCMCVLL